MDYNKYLCYYNDRSFWQKAGECVKKAGKELVYRALLLYYAANRPGVPIWVRTTIYGALGYFIFPIDVIPDLLPFAGYSDDFGALVLAVTTCSAYIDDEVKVLAKSKLMAWFGAEEATYTIDV